MSKGKMWAEWWIDCGSCDQHEPLAKTIRAKATSEAVKRGWYVIRGKWRCPACVAKLTENAQ